MYNIVMAEKFNSSEYKITKKETVYEGVHSDIDAVSVSKGNHEIPLLRKKHIGYSVEFMYGPNTHSFLKKKGYPVFPTWRYDEEEEVDYVTDLRRVGTHRVVDFCGHPDNYEKIYISNFADLEREASALLSKLADDGIVINEPNIFFDVEKSTGVAKIILGDLREMGVELDDGEEITRDQIFARDKTIIGEHMSRLKDIMSDEVE